MFFAYVPGERARKKHATPSGPGHGSFAMRGIYRLYAAKSAVIP
jgi:hypothetical protein